MPAGSYFAPTRTPVKVRAPVGEGKEGMSQGNDRWMRGRVKLTIATGVHAGF